MALEIPGNDTGKTIGSSEVLEALADDINDSEEVKPELDLSESTDESTDDEDSKDELTEDSTDDETDESKLKLTDDSTDELEYVEIPARQKILKEYPELFKKFPGIEKSIYREQEYAKVFATPREAESAKSRIEQFSTIESDLLNGNIGDLLASVKQANPKAFGKISGNLLQTMAAVDKDAYYGTVNHVIQHAINAAFTQGKTMGGEDGEQLTIAAQLLNKFIYGTTAVNAPQPLIKQDETNPKEKELQQRETAFNRTQLQTAVTDVTDRTRRTIQTAVEKYIDPKGMMGDYVKRTAIKDVIDAVDRELTQDTRFRGFIDRLWIESQRNNYSDDSKSKIRKAIINKAQSILPDMIRKVRADAMKGLNRTNGSRRRVGEDKNEVLKPENNGRQAASKDKTSSNNSKPTKVGSVKDVMRFLEN